MRVNGRKYPATGDRDGATVHVDGGPLNVIIRSRSELHIRT